ncbi:hypothetical protein BDA99DRAFT_499924 [Phascolomyces articulosus]|uniref:F-box domain-containing protein n=1 Tax=Phascolomyces articulosus TaxID=60185 RepID=A0AAD5PHE6_9FUNG|nr:hypothetical protein BDA99DRAFT_499924 [Phascolomyces articulosus]
MNLLSLANSISGRLPFEIVLVILSHLPVQDIVRLVQDDSPYFERLLLNHPFFYNRHLHVLLISDPLYSPSIQAQLIPGCQLPPIKTLEQHMLCLPPNPMETKAPIHFSLCSKLQLSRFEYQKRQIQFKPPSSSSISLLPTAGRRNMTMDSTDAATISIINTTTTISSSSTPSSNTMMINNNNNNTGGWVRPTSAGIIGVAVILTQNNVVLKRSLHAVNPIRTPVFERSHGYFGGQLEFEHHEGITRITKCIVGMDWFCC